MTNLETETSDILKRIEETIDNRKDEYLEVLYKLLRVESISAQNNGIDEACIMLKEVMEDAGIETKVIPYKKNPFIYGEIIRDPKAFTLLIYGHYDVQPPDPIDEWVSPPFEPTIRDGKIYCRGVGDNKGQLMAQILAVKSYIDTVGNLPINIKFIFEGEEEIGSPNLASFVAENKELLKADLVYTSDGPKHDSGAPLVLLGVRGMTYIELTAKGAEWDNHSGNKGNIVPNPAWKIIDLLNTMRDSEGRILIEGFYDNIRGITKREEEIIRSLPFDKKNIASQIGYEDFDMEKEDYYRKLTLEPTFNIAGFTSGYGGEGSKTIIPSTAVLKMDIRLVVDQDPDDIYEKFSAHVKKYAPDIEVKKLAAMKPSRTSSNLEIVDVITNAVRKAFRQEPVLQPSMGGSLPDYVWTDVLETPSIIIPYANFDEANHSPNEKIGVEDFINGIKCTCHVIEEIASR
ncbi:M20/M25/M40 family metallo-hydrolase [Paenisporosarcina sp. TG20]|uniref:M20/M25/M40 family metallo-hydrolase n=1 Tax=Paenisporosarcina sp. TG20 TaxID=1211706 RepID=UPI0002FD535B|nr:M20/M25/M40 family metallo-hydrolase [Paenisporosarcina sp. TG20]